jgi:hypothetical protein
VVPQLWHLHLLQALIYVAVILLARHNSAWGLGAGVTIAVFWNSFNLFATHLMQAGALALWYFLHTGQVPRLETMMVMFGGIAHCILIVACLAAFRDSVQRIGSGGSSSGEERRPSRISPRLSLSPDRVSSRRQAPAAVKPSVAIGAPGAPCCLPGCSRTATRFSPPDHCRRHRRARRPVSRSSRPKYYQNAKKIVSPSGRRRNDTHAARQSPSVPLRIAPHGGNTPSMRGG